MRPFIGAGDVVLSASLPATDPVPMGRVVKFEAAPGSATRGAIMHRIVGANEDGTLVTAGDANAQFDSAPLERERVDGVAVLLVRWVGLPVYWATSHNYGLLAAWLALTGLAIAAELVGLGGRPRPPRRTGPIPATALLLAGVVAFGVGANGQDASAAFTASTGSKGNSWTYAAAKPASRLAFITSPSNGTGGLSFPSQPVVRLLAADGSPSTAVKSVTLTLAGDTGTLKCTQNPVITVSGVASFKGCSVDKPGTYFLRAAASSLPTVSSSTFRISVGPAARLAFGSTPGTTAVTVPFSLQPTVRILDAGSNLTASTAPVTLSLTTPGGATLTCAQNPKAAVSGVATFSGCSVNRAGTYTLTAHATAVSDATSSPVTITPAPTLTCNSTVWMATFSWSPTPFAPTTYALYVNGIKVPATGADGWNSYVQLTSANVPPAQFPAGKASVEVRKVLTGGAEQVIGTGTVVLGKADYRTYLCS